DAGRDDGPGEVQGQRPQVQRPGPVLGVASPHDRRGLHDRAQLLQRGSGGTRALLAHVSPGGRGPDGLRGPAPRSIAAANSSSAAAFQPSTSKVANSGRSETSSIIARATASSSRGTTTPQPGGPTPSTEEKAVVSTGVASARASRITIGSPSCSLVSAK